MPVKNIVGQRFGMLVVTSFIGYKEYEHSTRRSLWACKCDCGNDHITTAKMLRGGSPISCGCAQKKAVSEAATTHGKSRTKLYKIWTSMKMRCHNINDNNWPRYGKRGIYVCDSWKDDFSQFYKDMGDKPEGMSLDRIDNNGPYSKDNCRWATKSDQGNNTRKTHHIKYLGRTQSLKQWCDELGVVYSTASARMKKYNSTPEIIFSKTRFSRGDLLSILAPQSNKTLESANLCDQ